MADLQCLEGKQVEPSQLPLAGSVLIEASAGTGKTFTIALLYVRCILGAMCLDKPRQPLMPPNILVMTFTEAATEELRDRVRRRLVEAAEIFDDQADHRAIADAEPLIAIREAWFPDRSQWPECRARLLLAAEWMDEAAISTIHGWCRKMLQEHAFDSGSLFELEIDQRDGDRRLLVTEDYWRTFVYPLAQDRFEYYKTLAPRPAVLASLLGQLSQVSLAPIAESDFSALLEDAITQAGENWQKFKERILVAFDELEDWLALRHQENNKSPAKRDLTSISGFFEKIRQGLAEQNRYKRAPAAEPKYFAWLRSTTLPIEVDTQDLPAFLRENMLTDVLENCAQGPTIDKSILIAHAHHWINQRADQLKQREGMLGFDDILTRLRDALKGLRGAHLADAIRQNYPVAMVDEFQDTDPVQYQIVDAIYQLDNNDSNTCILMIGDPKQAIYQFRGADIYTYLQARNAVGEQSLWTLGRNFRSHKSMVDAVNAVFTYGEDYQPRGAFLFGQGRAEVSDSSVQQALVGADPYIDRDYSPSLPDPDDRQSQSVCHSSVPFIKVASRDSSRRLFVEHEPSKALTFFADDHEAGTKGDAMVRVAESFASEISRLLARGRRGEAYFADSGEGSPRDNLRASDIAILVNNKTEASYIRRALAARNVRSVYLSDRQSVLLSTAARDVLYLLDALAHPTDVTKIRTAVAAPIMGQTLAALQALHTSEIVLENTMALFQEGHKRWQREGVYAACLRLFLHFKVPRQLLQNDYGERDLTDALHFLELLQGLSATLKGELSLLQQAKKLVANAKEDDENDIVRLESDSALVRVVTIHKSKGLEYPLVFLPFGTTSGFKDKKQTHGSFHDHRGVLQHRFTLSNDEVAKIHEETLAEDIRKCYVAFTRARYATWVGVPAIKNSEKSALAYLVGANNEDDNLQWALTRAFAAVQEIAILPFPDVSHERLPADTVPHLGAARALERSIESDWWISSYSAIVSAKGEGQWPSLLNKGDDDDGATETGSSSKEDTYHSFHRGAQVGNALHDILEWCCLQGFANILEKPSILQAEVVRRCEIQGWQRYESLLQRWFRALLSTPLLPDTLGCSLAQLKVVWPEMEFWLGVSHTNTTQLDALIAAQTVSGDSRPKLAAKQLKGLLKGFIDLVFEWQGRYYVLDYKSNFLGANDAAYTQQAMSRAILDKRYDVQYVLYVLALHRLLKVRLPNYRYDTHMGGAVYYFLRGVDSDTRGCFFERPPEKLITEIDSLLQDESTEIRL
jgi:exodeoxyribonuclease V beta subunit